VNRPRVIVNCAMTADGKLAFASGRQLRISSEQDMARVHRLRNSVDAIVVGVGTVLADDPKLTVKEKYLDDVSVSSPIRVVLDSSARIPRDALMLNDAAKSIVVVGKGVEAEGFDSSVELIYCDLDESGHVDVKKALEALCSAGISSVLVEGGSEVIWSMLRGGVVDELWTYIGPMVVGGKDTVGMTGGVGVDCESDLIRLSVVEFSCLGEGVLIGYKVS